MRYIKKYENYDLNYDIGDFVMLDPDLWLNEPFEIIEIDISDMGRGDMLALPYHVKSVISGDLYWVDDYHITKQLEPYEINALKYNL